jgi:hypothetical protein
MVAACLEPSERRPADCATCEARGRDLVELIERLSVSCKTGLPLALVPVQPRPLPF